jgi:hypothetical protein
MRVCVQAIGFFSFPGQAKHGTLREHTRWQARELSMPAKWSDLQVAFSVPGEFPFTIWGYGTADPLNEVLKPNYFAAIHSMVREGDLAYACLYPPEAKQDARSWQGQRHHVLLMIEDLKASCGPTRARLVQDFTGAGGHHETEEQASAPLNARRTRQAEPRPG